MVLEAHNTELPNSTRMSMNPFCFPGPKSPHVRNCDSVLLCEWTLLSIFQIWKHATDFSDLLIRQFRSVSILPDLYRRHKERAVTFSVFGVLFCCAFIKMVRVATHPVAAAVTDHSLRVSPVVQNERCSMRRHCAVLDKSDCDNRVSAVYWFVPWPAVVFCSTKDTVPEPIRTRVSAMLRRAFHRTESTIDRAAKFPLLWDYLAITVNASNHMFVYNTTTT